MSLEWNARLEVSNAAAVPRMADMQMRCAFERGVAMAIPGGMRAAGAGMGARLPAAITASRSSHVLETQRALRDFERRGGAARGEDGLARLLQQGLRAHRADLIPHFRTIPT